MLIIFNSSNSFCFLSYCCIVNSFLHSMSTIVTSGLRFRYDDDNDDKMYKWEVWLWKGNCLSLWKTFAHFPVLPNVPTYSTVYSIDKSQLLLPPITKCTVCPHRTVQHCTIIHFRCPWYFDPFSHTIAPTIAPTTTTNQLSNRGWQA
jgi:hypothetical protein